ncbi:MAG: AAA family ATPase [Gammaproteobacteria bacterium]
MILSDDIKDDSALMSTIEKAAARLAALSGASGGAAGSSGSSGAGAEQVHRPDLFARSDLFTTADVFARPDAAAGASYPDNFNSVGRPGYHEIDLKALKARGFLVPSAIRSPLSQQMRRLKRPLLLQMQKARVTEDDDLPANLIMVTSSLPGEGKTYTSINLAMSMAQEVDHDTLLVDADAARGDISRQLAVPSRPGLTSVLARGLDYAEGEIMDTNVSRLSLLPVGKPVEHVDALYASKTMKSILHGLASADPNRIVIFDCAPLLLATEVAVLARMMGQVLVVVEANRTPRAAVRRALGMLDGCNNVSLILNKTMGVDNYGYSYGYGYGAFKGDDSADGSVGGKDSGHSEEER